MKATYKTYRRKISKKDKWLIGSVHLGMVILIMNDWLLKDGSHAIFWTVYWLLMSGLIIFTQIKLPVAKINFENNKLVKGGTLAIHIPQILSLEDKEKGIRIRYIFNDIERVTFMPPVSDKDKPRLLADLLQINPNIVVNCYL